MERIIAIFKPDREEKTAEEKAYREQLMAIFVPNQRETAAYPGQLEANPEETEADAEHENLAKEQAAVKRVGGLRKRTPSLVTDALDKYTTNNQN
jgi:hypothetical protein